jgi:hypothetical protein
MEFELEVDIDRLMSIKQDQPKDIKALNIFVDKDSKPRELTKEEKEEQVVASCVMSIAE